MAYSLTHHLAHRQRLSSLVLSRAHEGNLAAQRLAGVKQAHLEGLPAYQEIERIYREAGPNLRAVIRDYWVQARAIASERSRNYRAAVAAEIISIDLGRAA